jgi:hypothetical protein
VAAFVGAVVGCLATLYLSAAGLAPAVASALATVLLCGPLLLALFLARATHLLPGELYAAIYGGSFGGMTPVLWLSSGASAGAGLPVSTSFILLALLCGLAFAFVAQLELCARRPLARGYGGRSGAIATAASLLFVALAPLFGGDDSLFRAARTETFGDEPGLITLTYIACTLGMFATLIVLRLPRLMAAGTAGRTFCAAALALAGLLILPLQDSVDVSALNGFYAGCFLGMSTPERLSGPLQPVLGAIVLTALLIYERGILSGIGGSLGFAAFVTVVVLTALNRMPAAIAAAIPPRRIVPMSAASGRLLAPPITGLPPKPGLPVVAAIIPVRRPRMIFVSIGSACAIVALLLPAELAPYEPAPSVVASAPARQPEPVPERPALMQAAATASATLAFVNVTADSSAPGAAAIRTAVHGVTEHEPAVGAVPAAVELDAAGELFHEFMKWRASQAAAPSGPQPASRRAAQLATAGAPHPVRPAADRRPVRSAAAAAARPVAPQPATRQ